MAFVPPHDRVLEHSTSNSQTVFTVTGAVDTSYNAFSASMSIGDTTIGGVVEPGMAFKSGKLTYSNTNEVTVDSSSFGGDSKGTFSSSGTKQVFMGLPSSHVLLGDGAQALSGTVQQQMRDNLGVVNTIQSPSGRITLTSGSAVMSSSVAGASSVLFTPMGGAQYPVYDGTRFAMAAFSELTNVLANSSSGNAGPAAVQPNANYDLYLWSPAGTPTLTRSDLWKKSSTVTMTIASPIVVTWSGSDFADGTPIQFSTTGALETGLTAGVFYYVKRTGAIGTPTPTFNLAATVGGAAINGSGTQSGTHTGFAGDDSGSVGVASGGNCERQTVNGLPLNKNAITNGPAAGRGLFVGTIRTNSSGTVDYIFGGAGAGGVAASFGLWNMFNRVEIGAVVQDNSAAGGGSYTYAVANTWRPAHGSLTYRVQCIRGIDVDPVDAFSNMFCIPGASGTSFSSFGVNSTVQPSPNALPATSTVNNALCFMPSAFLGLLGQGWSFLTPLEYNSSTTAATWITLSGQSQSGFKATLWL